MRGSGRHWREQQRREQAERLAEQQKGASREISANNVEMQKDGVHPGILTICRRLALMPAGKRGVAVALLHRYLQVLASRLEDPTVAEAKGEATSRPAEAGARPFVSAPGAAAA